MSNPNAIPPKETQFKPGQSGNPSGRKPDVFKLIRKFTQKEAFEFTQRIWCASKRELEEYVTSDPPIHLGIVARGLLRDYAKGDMVNWEKVSDRLYGRPVQKTELTGADGEPFGPTPAPIIQFVPLLTEQNEEKPALPDPGEINQTGVGMGQPDTGEQPCNANVERIPDVIPPEIDEMDDPPYFPT